MIKTKFFPLDTPWQLVRNFINGRYACCYRIDGEYRINYVDINKGEQIELMKQVKGVVIKVTVEGTKYKLDCTAIPSTGLTTDWSSAQGLPLTTEIADIPDHPEGFLHTDFLYKECEGYFGQIVYERLYWSTISEELKNAIIEAMPRDNYDYLCREKYKDSIKHREYRLHNVPFRNP